MATRSLLVAVVLVLAACGPAEETATEPSSPTPATAATPSPTAPPHATPTPLPTPEETHEPAPAAEEAAEQVAEPPADDEPDAAADAVGPVGTEDVEGGGFPSLAGDTAYLTDVRVGAHDGFDRVVLEFDGTSPPSHRIGFVDPPIVDDGSGEPIAVAGGAFLALRMTPASGVDLEAIDLTPTYPGPNRVAGAGTGVVTEAVRTGDFEATLSWVVGLEDRAPFTAVWLRDPLRLVVDVATG